MGVAPGIGSSPQGISGGSCSGSADQAVWNLPAAVKLIKASLPISNFPPVLGVGYSRADLLAYATSVA